MVAVVVHGLHPWLHPGVLSGRTQIARANRDTPKFENLIFFRGWRDAIAAFCKSARANEVFGPWVEGDLFWGLIVRADRAIHRLHRWRR